MKRLLFVFGMLTAVSPAFSVGTVNAGTMKFKVYKFAVSASVACTSPIEIFSDAAGVEQDMVTGPTFGSGRLAAGSYPCVMVEMSKVIQTSAATTSAGCSAGVTFNDVICQDTTQLSQTIAGVGLTCSGGVANDQHVTLFITTISAGTSGARALLPPTSETDTTSGLKLTTPFVVTAAGKTGTLTVTTTNFLTPGVATCSTNAPTFSFL